jgi:predicted metal-binding protein
MPREVRKIAVDMYEGRLQQDLERYRELALQLGATQAKIVRTADIPVDERVTLKCQIPRCFGYGVSAHCPPNTMKARNSRIS